MQMKLINEAGFYTMGNLRCQREIVSQRYHRPEGAKVKQQAMGKGCLRPAGTLPFQDKTFDAHSMASLYSFCGTG
ncbi:hypothetical protein ACWXWB_01075 [Pantoea dispersa]|uniref:hypothetical protein n=1 Tax=Pantoea dispersa TaxID=59814 RepID=UPI002DBD3344|nr:hypothetical protein [Pantoea dispersa]MEB5971802.1 hypothetical protein [Pantoea dispersa]